MNPWGLILKGAAFETGRQLVNNQRRGMGFSPGDYFDDYNDPYYYEDNYGSWWDNFGPDGDWRSGGGYSGGGVDLPFYDTPSPWDYWPGPGIDAGSPTEGYSDYLWNVLYNPSGIDYGYGSGFLPGPTGGGNQDTGWDWDSFWDWVTDRLAPSVTPPLDWQGPFPGEPDAPLPGYCPQGTYHPQNDPFACVPFPPGDPNAKKQAQQQRQQQQKAAQAARSAQKKQDQACPKDPQGRPVWRNPQTGKCELVPQCPPNTKFDSLTKRCLTAAQAKEIYGEDSNLWLWLLAGGAVLLIATRDRGGRRR